MKKVYLIPGLGADHRVFKYLELGGNYETQIIQWIPTIKGESLKQYAKRLSEQIDTPNPIIIGLSLGGLIGIEIAKLMATSQLILISSFKSRKEIPFYYKLAAKAGLHKIFTKNLLERGIGFFTWLFGVKDSGEKNLLHKIVHETNEKFLLWSLKQLMNWDNHEVIPNLIHIHGSMDRLLPLRLVQANYVIPQGGHFMIVNKGKEISQLVQEILRKD